MSLIVPVVEGHGEVQAVPRLVCRIAELNGRPLPRVNPPIRVKSGSFINDPEYMRKYVSLAAAKAAPARGLVLLLLDCDDACAAELGPRLLNAAITVRPGVSVLVCLAVREYEAWLVAASNSLGGVAGFPNGVAPLPDPEAIRDAKGWLSDRLSTKYDPIVHQAAFTSAVDLTAAAARSRSLSRLLQRVSAWLEMT